MNTTRQTEFTNVMESSVSNDAGLIIHRKIEILDISETLAEMFGYQYDQLIGHGITILDLIEPSSRGMVLKNTVVKYDRLYDATGLRKDGSTFPIKILDQPVAGQDVSTRRMMISECNGQMLTEDTVESLKETRQDLEEQLNRTTTQLRFTNERLQLELNNRVQIETTLRVRARQQAAVAELGQKALTGAELTALFTDAVSLAREADIILIAAGGDRNTAREGRDRNNLDLVGVQEELILALSELNKPIVLCLIGGIPYAIPHIYEKADVIYQCWNLGQETGIAIASVLFGEHNPSGKLTVSIPHFSGRLS